MITMEQAKSLLFTQKQKQQIYKKIKLSSIKKQIKGRRLFKQSSNNNNKKSQEIKCNGNNNRLQQRIKNKRNKE